MSIFRRMRLLNIAKALINPATEDKQDQIIALLTANKLYDTGNSTSTPLGISGNFKGDWIDTTGYVQAIIEVVTDEDAATNGMLFEYSRTGVADEVDHWHASSPLDNAADGGHHYPATLDIKYFRINYTNGLTAQTTFILNCTLFKNASEEGHVHPVNYVIDDDHPAPITRSILVAKTPGGSYVNIDCTTGENLKVALEEWDDSINPIRSDLEGVGDIAVGVAQVEIVITGVPHYIRIRADVDNTGIIFIGKTGVLSDGSNDFVRLEAGDEATIPYNDTTNALYAISDTAAQTINVGALL
jgi:hypothetical protein